MLLYIFKLELRYSLPPYQNIFLWICCKASRRTNPEICRNKNEEISNQLAVDMFYAPD